MQAVSCLSSYPYNGPNEQEKKLAKEIEEIFSFDQEDKEFLQSINFRLMTSELVKRHAGQCFSTDRKKSETRLLNIAKLSRFCPSVQIASTNALMILGELKFSFAKADLRGIHTKQLKLNQIMADEVNFKDAILKDAEFADCSLADANFEGADLENISFGRMPPLLHKQVVLAAVVVPVAKKIISNDSEALNFWDIESCSLLANVPEKKYTYQTSIGSKHPFFPPIHLQVILNEKFFARAQGESFVEIWSIDPFQKVYTEQIASLHFLDFFVATKDMCHLIGIGRLHATEQDRPTDPFNHQYQILIWEILSSAPPSLKLIQQKIISDTIRNQAYSPEKSLLAVSLYRKSRVQVMNVPSLQRLKQLTLAVENILDLRDLIFSPDGGKLFVSQRGELHAYQLENLEKRRMFKEERLSKMKEEYNPGPAIDDLQIFPTGTLIAYNTDGEFCVRDFRKNCQLIVRENLPHEEVFLDNRWISDGIRLIRLFNREIVMITLQSLAIKQSFSLIMGLSDQKFSKDSTSICILHPEGILYKYDTQTGREIFKRSLDEHRVAQFQQFVSSWVPYTSDFDHIYVCALSTDNKWVIGGYKGTSGPQILISDFTTGQMIWKSTQPFTAFALVEQTKRIVLAHENHLSLWDVSANRQIAQLPIDHLEPIQVEMTAAQGESNSIYLVIEQFTYNAEKKEKRGILYEINLDNPTATKIFSFKNAYRCKFMGSDLYLTVDGYQIVHIDCKNKKKKKIKFRDYIESFDMHNHRLITCSSLFKNSSLIFTDLKRKLKKEIAKISFKIKSVSFSPDGQYMFCVGEKHMLCYEIINDHLHLLWKFPKELDLRRVNIKNAKNLDIRISNLIHYMQENKKEI